MVYRSSGYGGRTSSSSAKVITVKKLSQSSYTNIRKLVNSPSSSSSLRKNQSSILEQPPEKSKSESSFPIKTGLGIRTKSFLSSAKNKIQGWSENVDYRFGGYLLGALTPSQAKLRRTQTKISESTLLNEAQKEKDVFDNQSTLDKLKREVEFRGEKEALDIEKDVANYKWYEYFNQEEKDLREAREQFAISQQQADLREQENVFESQLQERGFTDEQIQNIIKPTEEKGFLDNIFPTTTSKISSTVLLVGGGVLAYLLFKKK